MLDGPGRDLGASTDTKLVSDTLKVSLGRSFCDEETLAALAVG
jgi:hypothetical protein